jgi:hypothetical protein
VSSTVAPLSAAPSQATDTLVAWIGAAALYLVVSYPYHAILLSWLGPFPQAVYGVVSILAIALLFARARPTLALEYQKPAFAAACALAFTMLVTFAVHRNPTVIRELLLLGLLCALLFRARGEETLKLLRAMTLIHVAFLVPAMIVVALFYGGLIDWPTWRVERLGFGPANPLFIRSDYADFEYYLPLWTALIPHAAVDEQGFGVAFVRQPLVFIEPTDTWLYSTALFWYAIADPRMPLRKFCIGVLALALLVSFSVAGILATAGAIVLCVAVSIGGRAMVPLAILAGALLLMAVPLETLLNLIGANKGEQLVFYRENVTVLDNLTLLGNAPAADEEPTSYGFLIVPYRYGLVGAAVILGVIAAMAFASLRLLGDAATLGWRRFPLFIGCFVSLVMLAKYPGIVPAMETLSLAAALSLRQRVLDPFSRALLH